MDIGVHGCIVEVEPSRSASEHVTAIFGGLGNMGGKASEARDFRRQVVNRDRTPGAVCVLAARRSPQSLAGVKVSRSPTAEALRDQSRPVDARYFGGQIRDGG